MLLATLPQTQRNAGTSVLPDAQGADVALLFPVGFRAVTARLLLAQVDIDDPGLSVRLLVEGLQDDAWRLVDDTSWTGGGAVRAGRTRQPPSTTVQASYALPFSRLRLSVTLSRRVKAGITFEAS